MEALKVRQVFSPQPASPETESLQAYTLPENAEIPAGLDKEVIVVRQPADHIYAGTNKIISKIAKLGQTDKVTAVGVKKKKCKNETIKEKME